MNSLLSSIFVQEVLTEPSFTNFHLFILGATFHSLSFIFKIIHRLHCLLIADRSRLLKNTDLIIKFAFAFGSDNLRISKALPVVHIYSSTLLHCWNMIWTSCSCLNKLVWIMLLLTIIIRLTKSIIIIIDLAIVLLTLKRRLCNPSMVCERSVLTGSTLGSFWKWLWGFIGAACTIGVSGAIFF